MDPAAPEISNLGIKPKTNRCYQRKKINILK
jgi:hypothetical protein